jgi:FkbM family methyltransferase
MLCGTMAINGLTNVFCHQLAVGNNDIAEIEISLPNYNSFNNFGGLELIAARTSDNQNMTKYGSEIVKVITLDSLGEKVDFIKMDIEGMEDKAVEGAKETIDKHRPICFIEIAKTNFDSIFTYFKSKKYSAYINSMDAIFIPDEYHINITDLRKVS